MEQTDYFKCEYHRARMPVRTCILRQKNTGRGGSWRTVMRSKIPYDPHCVSGKCAQGIEIAAAVAETEAARPEPERPAPKPVPKQAKGKRGPKPKPLPTEKRCPKCQAVKPASEYYTTRHGRPYTYCKPCHIALANARRDRKKIMKETKMNDTPEQMKRCKDCGETHPISRFYKDKSSSDGHRHACMACEKVRKRRWREAVAAGKHIPGKRGVEASVAATDRPLLLLDFGGNESLLETVRSLARSEFRSPEMQILYWLKSNLAAQNPNAGGADDRHLSLLSR